MRALFFGTPEIAVPALRALCDIADVVAVVCQPDKPAGRGLAMHEPAVKVAARELGVEVHQPSRIKKPEFAEWVASCRADVALVMAYGRILPPAVLNAPAKGCMNLHASLLPKYRGAAPITWCVVRGETETGVCLMQMDEGMDTGPVYTSRRTPIGPDQTAGEVAGTLADLAAIVVREDLPRAVAGELLPVAQQHDAATYAPMLDKSHGLIDWSEPAKDVHNHVRGMSPWPGAHTRIHGKLLKILQARVHQNDAAMGLPGTLIMADPTAILVACGQGSVQLLRLQLEGRKAMAARDMVIGRAVAQGDVLGDLP